MKRSYLVLLPVLLLVIAASAAGEQVPVEPSLLLASSCEVPASSAEANTPGATPEPIWLNHCTAQQNCPSGGQVSCQGHSSCQVGSYWVSCDGVVHECTQCGEPVDCIDPGAYCACVASGGFSCYAKHCLNCFPLHPDCSGG